MLFGTQRHIAPLVVLRIVFGSILFFSTIRFMAKGWITDFYISPKIHFTFYGCDWIKPFGDAGMHIVFVLMMLTSLCIALGLFYKLACFTFFVCFTYVELIDKTYYLNHYYFVSLIAFLLLFIPAQKYFSLDVLRKPEIKINQVAAWTITIFKLQIFIVYFFAGISKINSDWLLDAMPLKIWLPANTHLPLIGPLLGEEWVAYLFSWFGMLFDVFIVFFLLKKSTRNIAYLCVILFHVFTAWFFKIGVFPFIMMGLTLIFFPEAFHIKLLQNLRLFSGANKINGVEKELGNMPPPASVNPFKKKFLLSVLMIYFVFQVLIPLRYLLYPGKLFWTEEGYRFSWRVMLMEKSGTIFFTIKNPETGKSSEIRNCDYLSPFQEKMMATQPDMILQFANYLKTIYTEKGIKNPVITAESYVTLNGRGSRPFIKSNVDLGNEKESFGPKHWILPY